MFSFIFQSIFKVSPAYIRSGFDILFSFTSLDTVVLYFNAISDKVSPHFTTYVFPLILSLRLCEIVIISPAYIKFGFLMLFICAKCLTVVLYFTAISDKVSPDLILYFILSS